MGFLEYFSDKTLNIVYAICLFIILLVLWIIYPIYKKEYIRRMIKGYLCLSIAMFLVPLREFLPSFISIIIGNQLIIVGEYIVMISFLEMFNKQVRYKYYYVLFTLFSIIHVYYTYITPNVSIRIMNYSAFLIIPMLFFIVQFFNSIKKVSDLSIIAIWLTYIVMVLFNFTRLLNAIGFEEITELYRGASIFKAYILVSISTNIIKIISILINNTRDLVE